MTLRINQVVCAVVLSTSLITVAPAQENKDLKTLQEENTQLRNRVDKLENELSEIKQMLGKPAEPKPAAPAEPKTPIPPEFTVEETTQLKKLAAMKDKPVHSSLDLRLYGYVKLDAAYDDSRTSVGNYARWVESEGVRGSDDQFSMTANQTRLGLDITGPPLPVIKTSGRVEIDFYGAGTAENKPEPLLRHAYINAEWPEYHISMLAGQTFDIISPLWAPTVNYTVGWWQGNIGYRRPQLRLTEEIPLANNWSLKFEEGATRTITGRKFYFASSTDPDSGDDEGLPSMQGRASLTFPIADKRQGTIGVSGHWGEEEQHVTATSGDRHIQTWSVNVDVRLPVTKWLTLQAEGFTGEDLDAYLGAIGQGYNTNTLQGINSMGGWVAATLDPHPKWQFNVGAGVDDPDNGDLSDPTARSYNSVVFGNGYYFLTSNLSLGLEISHLRTRYLGQAPGDDWREQMAVIYKF